MASTLFCSTRPVGEVVGRLPDGTMICHGKDGDEIPAKATIYRDGSDPWTWMEFAAEYPKEASVCVPHQYPDDPPACDGDIIAYCAAFPLTANALLE